MISHTLPSSLISSAPASSTALSSFSSSACVFSTITCPLRLNIQATLFSAARLPLCLLRRYRISPTVRFLLSVSVEIISATPPGPYPSYMISSYETPGSSPVPRRMARSMFSRGMLFALASAMMVRSRGFMSGSPPPPRAATVSSLMRRVKILPRFASAAPFLCLIVCHLECPDMRKLSRKRSKATRNFTTRTCKVFRLACEDHPHLGARIPRPSVVVAEQGANLEARLLEPSRHLRHRQGPEREREATHLAATPGPLRELLVEDGEMPRAILPDRLDERHVRAAGAVPPAGQADALPVLFPRWQIGHQLEPEGSTRFEHVVDC